MSRQAPEGTPHSDGSAGNPRFPLRRSLRRAAATWLLLAAGMVLLRTGIVEIRQESAVMQGQHPLVLDRVDPAALFYTEIPLALAAEKEVRRRVEALSADAAPR